jgi:hypothetical protein
MGRRENFVAKEINPVSSQEVAKNIIKNMTGNQMPERKDGCRIVTALRAGDSDTTIA